MKQRMRTFRSKILGATLSCLFFLCAGPVVIFCNKELQVEAGFKYSMAVSMLGTMASSMVCWIGASLGLIALPHKSQVTSKFYLQKIIPIAITSASTIYFGNLAYLHLSVSFVQICKAFGPVITLIVGFVLGTDSPTLLLMAAIFLISIGTAAAASGEMRFSIFGFAVIMAAQLSEGIKLILQQLLTGNKLKFSVWEGLYYMSPPCCAFLLIGHLVVEFPQMPAGEWLQKVTTYPGMFVVAGIGGFCVNLAVFLVVQSTSALSLKVLATLRNIGIVYVSTLRYGDPLSQREVTGYLISLVGFMLYQYSKFVKGDRNKKQKVANA